MLDHGPVTQVRQPVLAGPRAAATHAGDDVLLRRKVEQQRLALAHLSEALIGLQRGTKALQEENRELRRELEAARGGGASS